MASKATLSLSLALLAFVLLLSYEVAARDLAETSESAKELGDAKYGGGGYYPGHGGGGRGGHGGGCYHGCCGHGYYGGCRCCASTAEAAAQAQAQAASTTTQPQN